MVGTEGAFSRITKGHGPRAPAEEKLTTYDQIININSVIARFGVWPSFHDAEVVSVTFAGHRPQQPSCVMVIHAWLMTDRVDARGYYILEKHTLVTFCFEQLIESEFRSFNHQNCLSSLWIKQETFENEPALRVEFPSNYGFDGSMLCRRVVVVNVQPCDELGQPVVEG